MAKSQQSNGERYRGVYPVRRKRIRVSDRRQSKRSLAWSSTGWRVTLCLGARLLLYWFDRADAQPADLRRMIDVRSISTDRIMDWVGEHRHPNLGERLRVYEETLIPPNAWRMLARKEDRKLSPVQLWTKWVVNWDAQWSDD